MAHRQTKTAGPAACPRHGRRARPIASARHRCGDAAAHATPRAPDRVPHLGCGSIEAVLGTRCCARSRHFRTSGAAPLKLRSPRGVPGGRSRPAPRVRPRYVARLGQAATGQGKRRRASRRTISRQEGTTMLSEKEVKIARMLEGRYGEGAAGAPGAASWSSITLAVTGCVGRPARRGRHRG